MRRPNTGRGCALPSPGQPSDVRLLRSLGLTADTPAIHPTTQRRHIRKPSRSPTDRP